MTTPKKPKAHPKTRRRRCFVSAPTGLTPGQKIAISVAVQRKSGLSSYTEALSATVR